MTVPQNVFVTINTNKRIPFINRSGPIDSPIAITREVYDNLLKLGYPVKIHENVIVNQITGHRHLVSAESFIPRLPDQNVDVDTSAPEPALVPPNMNGEASATAPVVIDQPAAVADQAVDLTEADDTVPEEETEEEAVVDQGDDTEEDATDDAANELELYDVEVYKGWSKTMLQNYLRKAESVLPEDVIADINTATKAVLLDYVLTHVLPAFEEEEVADDTTNA